MGSGATAKYALEYPLGTDAPSIPGDIQTLAQMVDAIFVGFAPDDTKANRPAVGKSGRMFTESAASAGLPGTMWREDGATWRAMGSRIQPTGTTDIGQVVRAITGQTADLFHVEDPVGNPYLKVGSNGATSITPGGASTAAQALLAQSGPVNQRAMVAKMASGQTANPFEVQDTTGAIKAFIDNAGSVSDASGRVYSPGNANLAATVSAMTGWGLASAVGTGTAFARSDHNHGTPPTPVTSVTAGSGIGVSAGTGAVTITNTGVTSVAGRVGGVSLTAADIAAGTFPGANSFSGLQTFLAGVLAKPATTAGVAATVQALVGQTGDLFQAKDSAGTTVLAKVTSAGKVLGVGDVTAGTWTCQPRTAGANWNTSNAHGYYIVKGGICFAWAEFQTGDSRNGTIDMVASGLPEYNTSFLGDGGSTVGTNIVSGLFDIHGYNSGTLRAPGVSPNNPWSAVAGGNQVSINFGGGCSSTWMLVYPCVNA